MRHGDGCYILGFFWVGKGICEEVFFLGIWESLVDKISLNFWLCYRCIEL